MVAKRTATALLLSSLLVLSCKHSDPFIITGASIDLIGQQFIATNKLMSEALDSNLITQFKYDEWKKFALVFQKGYPVLVDMWDVAASAEDPNKREHISAVISDMLTQLNGFYNEVRK